LQVWVDRWKETGVDMAALVNRLLDRGYRIFHMGQRDAPNGKQYTNASA
jgi:hypothetical protein